MPTTGDLTAWAKQGILLLNCALTTVVGRPREHINIWEPYTDYLIETISNLKINGKHRPIFMLWGNYAKCKKYLINKKCNILVYSHPSPLAQSKEKFIHCNHFTEVNTILRNYNIEEIKWEVSEIESRFDMDNRTCIVFTDGSCFPNKECPESEAGYASCFCLGVHKDTILYGNLENRPYYATNNRAEGFAIYKTMLFLDDDIKSWDKVIIVTDSNFWIQMFEVYMPMWERRNIPFTGKKNSDMTIPMYNLYKKIILDYEKKIEFRHVKSHNKDNWLSYPLDSYEYFCAHNNDYIDQMAKYARIKLIPGKHIIESVDYNLLQ